MPERKSDEEVARGGYDKLPSGPKMQRSWKELDADLTTDHLNISGHPVMEKWETPYMGELARVAATNGGIVLEVGFGMAISATAIQKFENVTEHLIMEFNGAIFQTLLEFKGKHPKVTPIFGDCMQTINDISDGYLDAIMYDTYPLSKESQHIHQFDFIKACRSKLSVGGTLTYCNLTSLGVLKAMPDYNSGDAQADWSKLMEETQIQHLLDAGWHDDEINFSVFQLPQSAIDERESIGCDYYSHPTCLVPLLVKRRE